MRRIAESMHGKANLIYGIFLLKVLRYASKAIMQILEQIQIDAFYLNDSEQMLAARVFLSVLGGDLWPVSTER